MDRKKKERKRGGNEATKKWKERENIHKQGRRKKERKKRKLFSFLLAKI